MLDTITIVKRLYSAEASLWCITRQLEELMLIVLDFGETAEAISPLLKFERTEVHRSFGDPSVVPDSVTELTEERASAFVEVYKKISDIAYYLDYHQHRCGHDITMLRHRLRPNKHVRIPCIASSCCEGTISMAVNLFMDLGHRKLLGDEIFNLIYASRRLPDPYDRKLFPHDVDNFAKVFAEDGEFLDQYAYNMLDFGRYIFRTWPKAFVVKHDAGGEVESDINRNFFKRMRAEQEIEITQALIRIADATGDDTVLDHQEAYFIDENASRSNNEFPTGPNQLAQPSNEPKRPSSPWIDTIAFIELMRLNAIVQKDSGKSQTNIRRYKLKWRAIIQPGSNGRRFRFDLQTLREKGVTYPPEWNEQATSPISDKRT